MSIPALSVLVPTYRRPALLERCLRALLAQEGTGAGYEVVVVDDGSGDTTGEVIAAAEASDARVRGFRQEANAGPAAARNRGLAEARGAIVLFVDDDVIAPPDLVARHIDFHQRTGDPLAGLLGRVDWHPDLRITPFMRWLDRSGLQFAYDTWLREGPVDPPAAAFYTANLSAHRSLLAAEGGFDERFPYPAYEDIELAWRLADRGFRLEYRPDVLAWHGRPIDLATFRRRMARVAESAAVLRELQPDFPVDDSRLERWVVPARERWRLRMLAPVAAVLRRHDLLDRHYRAEVAAGYSEGRERARERPC